MMSERWENIPSVQRFREYLRIPSVHPDVDYSGCVEFLTRQAAELQLPVKVYEIVPKKPVVVITWSGLEPKETAIMLNSHMDVVAVWEDRWTYPPFSAHLTEDGRIYGRGAQDMKCVGIQHLEAVRTLKNAGVRLKRTVHVTFVPDEETGGYDGMKAFVETEEFRALNIGFALDESKPGEDDAIIAHHGERTTLQFEITARGIPGHGSSLPSDTAGEKLHYLIEKFMKLRALEKAKVDSGAWIGDVTSINITQLMGGVQPNILPDSLSAVIDCRLAPDVDVVPFTDMVETWCKEAGPDVTYKFVQWNPYVRNTNMLNPFVVAVKNSVKQMGMKMELVVCPGGTDARYVRSKAIPALGFSPLTRTPNLLHAHDEWLHADVLEQGIRVIEHVLRAVSDV